MDMFSFLEGWLIPRSGIPGSFGKSMFSRLLVKVTAPFTFPWLLHFFSTTVITMIIKLISKWKYKILGWSLCQSYPQIILLTSPPIPKYMLTICVASHNESYKDSHKNSVVLSSLRLIHLIFLFLKKTSEISMMGVTISTELIGNSTQESE